MTLIECKNIEKEKALISDITDDLEISPGDTDKEDSDKDD